MNLFKRNMFGELNWFCFLFGHKFGLCGEIMVCQRCELDNPKLWIRGE